MLWWIDDAYILATRSVILWIDRVLSIIWIIFSGLFRFSRIYSIGDSAETVAIAITSIRCNGVVTTSPRHAKCIAHFLSSSGRQGTFGRKVGVGWLFNSRRQLSVSTKCIRYWLRWHRRYEPHLMYTSFRTVCYRFKTWTAFWGKTDWSLKLWCNKFLNKCYGRIQQLETMHSTGGLWGWYFASSQPTYYWQQF